MKSWKIAALITCSWLTTIPVLAIEQPKNIPPTNVTQPKVEPKKEEAQTSFDKKFFVEQISKSPEFLENNGKKNIDLSAAFDLLDKNRDGKVDGKELQEYSDNDTSDDNDDYSNDVDDDTPDDLYKNLQTPSVQTPKTIKQNPPDSKAGAGIPPINADQLLK